MVFHINTVIHWLDGDIYQRILWLTPLLDEAFVIQLRTNKGMPERYAIADLNDAFERNALRLLDDEAFSAYTVSENTPQKYIDIRDERYQLLQPLLEALPEMRFSAQQRGKIIASIMKEQGVSKAFIYKILRQYWQQGQTKNALLPSYHRSGKSKEEVLKKNKKKSNVATYRRRSIHGYHVTEKTMKLFEKGIRDFYASREKRSLKDAYILMLGRYFNQGYVKDKHGVEQPILPTDPKALPTFWQFRNWYRSHYNKSKVFAKREGNRNAILQQRSLEGSHCEAAFAPGSYYQIDATLSDIHLVSANNRAKRIGRPVTYIVIDVFSKMITGLLVTLENPSYVAGTLALANTLMPKIDFCAQYGITICSQEWPSQQLCQTLVADRGEFESKLADNIIDSLGLTIYNTPPYRGDLKGLVERYFKRINKELIQELPGRVEKQCYGAKDARLDACLTLYEYTQLTIHQVLHYNNHHTIKNFNFTPEMLKDNLIPTPRNIWDWGIKNRSGVLQHIPFDTAKRILLPTQNASITPKGIRLRNLHYTCQTAQQENWFGQARAKQVSIKVGFNPWNVNTIYYYRPDGDLELCELTQPDQRFIDQSFDDVALYYRMVRGQEQNNHVHAIASRIRLHQHTENIVSSAQREANLANLGLSKSEQKANNIANRSKVKRAERVQSITNKTYSEFQSSIDTPIDIDSLGNIGKLRQLRHESFEEQQDD